MLGGMVAGQRATATSVAAEEVPDYTTAVNLFIGTGGHGHTHPAATVPHGMVQPGPDTRWRGWDACSGYHYDDTTINGFSYTRMSGTGCADFGDFLLMPISGTPDMGTPTVAADDAAAQRSPWASSFSHAKEVATPGYYAVRLQRYGIDCEMTASSHSAFHRFTWSASDMAARGILLDIDYHIGEAGRTLDASVEVVDAYTLRAMRRSRGWTYDKTYYLYACFSVPFRLRSYQSAEGHRVAYLQFPDTVRRVEIRSALSAVDAAGARKNLEAEIPRFDGDAVRTAARQQWQQWLSKIDVYTTDDSIGQHRKTVFYTALYHCALAPILYSDVDGRYRGMDLCIHHDTAAAYTLFSLWDTFRALHPLLTLIDPETNAAFLRHLLRSGREGGMVPKWDCAANYTACMTGYHFVSLCADAYAKGQRDFDLSAALYYGDKAARGDTMRLTSALPRYKVDELLPVSRRLNTRRGYVPCDSSVEATARGLEYAYDDWCLSQLYTAARQRRQAADYRHRSRSYLWYLDKKTGYMRGRRSDGSWRRPFDADAAEHHADDYVEGTARQWTWFVPHDVRGLSRRMGGHRRMGLLLDSLFTLSTPLRGTQISPDITGMVGQYAQGNEPGHHVPYLYNYIGQPLRTRQICDTILQHLYTDAPDGLCGNEDCGQLSAWYVLSAVGLYQVCPGRPVWTMGSPLFHVARLHLPGAKEPLTVLQTTPQPSRRGKTLWRWCGHRLRRPFLRHKLLSQGGILEVMAYPEQKR